MPQIKGKQVFDNTKWIIACKIAQSLLQFVIGMLSARYLGPSNYGLINYAASIVAFFMPIMKLGLDATLVNELLKKENKQGEILGTSLTLNVFSAIFSILGVTLFAFIANPGEIDTVIVCVLYSTSILFAAIEMIQYWFQYKLLSKYSSLVMLCAYVIVSAYKIYLLITGKNVFWFAVSHTIEYAIVGLSLVILYLKKEKQYFSFSFTRAKEMLRRSKHYIIASLMVVIYQNTDHIMLTTMISEEENGYYSAAITSATVLQFVYIAIMDSFRPLIFSSKKDENEGIYRDNISRLYCLIVYLSVAQSIVFTLFSGLIINVLYGSEYASSVSILQILTWFCTFSFMGTIRNIWLLAEEKQKILPLINLLGVIINILLNIVLIPFYGAAGAATASLATQIFINFILGFIMKPIRPNNKLLLKGLNPKFAYQNFKNLVYLINKKN